MNIDVLSLIRILPNGTKIEIYDEQQVPAIDYDFVEHILVYSGEVGKMIGQNEYLSRYIASIRIPHGLVEVYLSKAL